MNAPIKKEVEVLENRHGRIPVGTRVAFEVENQEDWGGDLSGVLIYEDGEFKIKTDLSGTLTIGKKYDVYFNTIRPLE